MFVWFVEPIDALLGLCICCVSFQPSELSKCWKSFIAPIKDVTEKGFQELHLDNLILGFGYIWDYFMLCDNQKDKC